VLETLIYDSLTKGRIPRVANTKSSAELALERVKSSNRFFLSYLNKASYVKAQSPTKVITITEPKITGYRAIISNAYLVKAGDTITFKATYKYSGRKPEAIRLYQSIDGTSQEKVVLFTPKSQYLMEVSKKITDPANINCKAETMPRRERVLPYIRDYIREANTLIQTYPIGLYDDRYKPVSEYPVSGVDNAVLDIAYSWKVQNTVYPTPVPSGITIDTLSLTYYSGFIDYEGKKYKDPTKNNTVKVKARIVNNTGYSLTLSNYGLVVSTLYEDNIHVSQAVVDIGNQFPSTSLPDGAYYIYELSVNLPTWAYGRVAIAHAINFIRGNTLFWTGGPFYCFEVFRLRLP
jgi:hypothetical protein